MKKLLFIALLSFIVLSCEKNPAPKPKRLLSENTMADIAYDIAILQSVKSFDQRSLDTNRVNSSKYIFEKYHIDSLTFAQNQVWYASDLEKYEKIQQKVKNHIDATRNILKPNKDTLSKKGENPNLKVRKDVRIPDNAGTPK